MNEDLTNTDRITRVTSLEKDAIVIVDMLLTLNAKFSWQLDHGVPEMVIHLLRISGNEDDEKSIQCMIKFVKDLVAIEMEARRP